MCLGASLQYWRIATWSWSCKIECSYNLNTARLARNRNFTPSNKKLSIILNADYSTHKHTQKKSLHSSLVTKLACKHHTPSHLGWHGVNKDGEEPVEGNEGHIDSEVLHVST